MTEQMHTQRDETTPHASGPWTVDGPPWNQIVWSGPEKRVCFLAHSMGIDDERDVATGRLIAAAPDLLDALKRLLELGIMNPAGSRAVEGAIEAARAAVSRAEVQS